jgi:hypothetical protein
MIIQSKETTLAYRCPVCGKFIFGMAGLFTLTGDLIKLKCDCGGSELKIAYSADRKLRITVPCLFCPDPHTYVIGADAFFDRELLALGCTYSNMDILREVTFHSLCCVKSTRKVSRELKFFIDDSLDELSENGYFDTSDSQCEEMMTSRCMGTFKSMYQWVYGRKFK